MWVAASPPMGPPLLIRIGNFDTGWMLAIVVLQWKCPVNTGSVYNRQAPPVTIVWSRLNELAKIKLWRGWVRSIVTYCGPTMTLIRNKVCLLLSSELFKLSILYLQYVVCLRFVRSHNDSNRADVRGLATEAGATRSRMALQSCNVRFHFRVLQFNAVICSRLLRYCNYCVLSATWSVYYDVTNRVAISVTNERKHAEETCVQATTKVNLWVVEASSKTAKIKLWLIRLLTCYCISTSDEYLMELLHAQWRTEDVIVSSTKSVPRKTTNRQHIVLVYRRH